MKRVSPQEQSGYILVVSLLVAALVLILSGAALVTALAGSKRSHQSAESTQAFYLAQAGLEDVVNYIQSGGAFPSGDSTYGPYTLGAGSYSVQVTFTSPNTYSFASTGTVHGSSRTVKAGGSLIANNLVYGFGNRNETWDQVSINGAYAGGTASPAVVQYNANLRIANGTLGGVISGNQVNASITAVGQLRLGNATLKTPACSASGSPWQSPNGRVTLYGTANGCGSALAYTPANYAQLRAQAQMGGENGQYLSLCSAVDLAQSMHPAPFNNYVLFMDCSGYTGGNQQIQISTDNTGLAGTFTLVIYANGNPRITGLVLNNFNAQPGAGLGIISDVPNQVLNGSTVTASLRFDATSQRTTLQNATINGSLTAYDIRVPAGAQATFNVNPAPVPPGFTAARLAMTTWSN